jgi:glycosyltransferase involved in cell wall biosynthesis
MRILQLCTKVPYPPKDGGAAGVYFFSKAFSDLHCEIDILAVNPPKHHISESFFSEVPSSIHIHPVPFNTRPRADKALRNLFFSKMPYFVERFINPDYLKSLLGLLNTNQYDVIQIEGVYLCPYLDEIRKHTKAKVVLRAHNIEYALWQDIAVNEKIIFKRVYLRLQAKRLKKFEIARFSEVDGVTSVTPADCQVITSCCKNIKAMVAPFGIEPVQCPAPEEFNPHALFFLGALDWLPNIEAIQWFVLQIWPEIHRIYPEMRFHVAGRNPSPSLALMLSQRKGVEFYGEVANARSFMQPYSIMVVPLFSGSGIRVKIIEAMQLGKIVIASAKAVDGIPAVDGEHLFIAESLSDYASCIRKLISTPQLAATVSENASKFVNEQFNVRDIAANVLRFYDQI